MEYGRVDIQDTTELQKKGDRRNQMIKHKNYSEKNNPGRPVVFYVLLVIFCFLLAGTGFVCFRLRNGVQVRPPQGSDILPDTEVVLYRQDDERWGENRLGDSEYTLRSSGCLVSCIASALSMERGMEETPGTLNEKFSERQAYDAEGNLQWAPLSVENEYQVDVYGEVSADIIDACLSQGHYPVVRVRMYALGNVHYVLIVGAKDGEYLCMDPLRDDITGLSSYGNRVYAIRCVYSGDQSLGKDAESDTTGSKENADITAL